MNKTTAIQFPSTLVDEGAVNAPANPRTSLGRGHRWARWTGKEVGSARYYEIQYMVGWLIDEETTTSSMRIAKAVFAEYVEVIEGLS